MSHDGYATKKKRDCVYEQKARSANGWIVTNGGQMLLILGSLAP